MSRGTQVYLHSILEKSTVNGPGERTVIHFQGCTIGCKGCFNVHTWAHKKVEPSVVKDVLTNVTAMGNDITISGGEPLEQMPALLKLLYGIKRRMPDKTVIIFTGMTKEVLEKYGILGFLALAGVDLVIAGPYDQDKSITNDLRGSHNQEFIFLSNNIVEEDLQGRRLEIVAGADGSLTMSGFPSKKLAIAIQRAGE